MQKKIIILFLAAFPLLSVSAQQRTRTLVGLVTGEKGEPLENVSVQIKGKNYFSGTQADGIYYIPVESKDSALVFRYPGYAAKEIRITGEREYNIQLRSKNEASAPVVRSGK